MTSVLVWALAGGVVTLAVVQLAVVAAYCVVLRRAGKETDRSFQPSVAIVLCLRGADPFLRDCLRSLAAQDYANFRIICAFDSSDDPAMGPVNEMDDPRVSRVVAPSALGTCSLKNHLLINAIQQVWDEVEVVVSVDADAIVDPNWLSELVAPLRDENVAVSSGNRWFQPSDRGLGSLVRWIWHLGAAPQMYFLKIPWGGSMAIRTRFAKDVGLLDVWSKSLSDDVPLAQMVNGTDAKIKMVPQLLMSNRESASMGQVATWMRRQLLLMKLYHGKFVGAFAHCILSSMGILMTTLGVAVAFATPGGWDEWMLGGALLTYYGTCWMMWFALESSAQRILAFRQGESLTDWEAMKNTWRQIDGPMVWAMIVSQWVYFWAFVAASRLRNVRWRGIEYVILDRFHIKMGPYRRYSSLQVEGQSIEE